MSALLLSSNYLGSMIAPLIMAPMLIYFGWRHAFEVIGVIGVLFAYYFAVPRPTGAGAGQPTKESRCREHTRTAETPLLWQLLIPWFGLSSVNKGLDAWMPIYLLQARGLDLSCPRFFWTPICPTGGRLW